MQVKTAPENADITRAPDRKLLMWDAIQSAASEHGVWIPEPMFEAMVQNLDPLFGSSYRAGRQHHK